MPSGDIISNRVARVEMKAHRKQHERPSTITLHFSGSCEKYLLSAIARLADMSREINMFARLPTRPLVLPIWQPFNQDRGVTIEAKSCRFGRPDR
jgi:hypothetical protein